MNLGTILLIIALVAILGLFKDAKLWLVLLAVAVFGMSAQGSLAVKIKMSDPTAKEDSAQVKAVRDAISGAKESAQGTKEQASSYEDDYADTKDAIEQAQAAQDRANALR